MYFYIDGKFDLNKKEQIKYYFICGISVDDKNSKPIAEFVKDFKKKLKPNLSPEDWYLKESVIHPYKDKNEIIKK